MARPVALALAPPSTSVRNANMPDMEHEQCSKSGIDMIGHRGGEQTCELAASYVAQALFHTLSAASAARVRSRAASCRRLPRSVEGIVKQTTS